jgi:hypothetical protein
MSTSFDDAAQPRSLPGLGEQLIDGEAVIVNAQGGEILVLNECGALIWQLLDGRHSVSAIVERVREAFDVEEGTAAADVREFLSTLSERGALA